MNFKEEDQANTNFTSVAKAKKGRKDLRQVSKWT